MFGETKVKKVDYIDKIVKVFTYKNEKIKFNDGLILALNTSDAINNQEKAYLTMDDDIVDIFRSLKNGSEKAFNIFYFYSCCIF